jgi:hypothetical protein
MINFDQGNALFSDCEGFLTELSATDEAVLTGGKGHKGKSGSGSGKSKSKSKSGSGSGSGGYGCGCGYGHCYGND